MSALLLPRYLPNLDPKFTEIWEKVISLLPSSQRILACDNKPVSIFKEVDELEENKHIVKYELEFRWADICNNGHNTFSCRIYAYIQRGTSSLNITKEHLGGGGSVRYFIEKWFPQYVKYIPYAQCLYSVYGPLYYFENTAYFASNVDFTGYKEKQRELANAQHSANWPELTMEDIENEQDFLEALANRLPGLMFAFKKDIEELGFTY